MKRAGLGFPCIVKHRKISLLAKSSRAMLSSHPWLWERSIIVVGRAFTRKQKNLRRLWALKNGSSTNSLNCCLNFQKKNARLGEFRIGNLCCHSCYWCYWYVFCVYLWRKRLPSSKRILHFVVLLYVVLYNFWYITVSWTRCAIISKYLCSK